MILRSLLALTFLALIVPAYFAATHLQGPYKTQTEPQDRMAFIGSVFFAFIALAGALFLLSVLIFWAATGRLPI